MKNKTFMKSVAIAALAAALPLAASAADHGHNKPNRGKASPGALVEEMRALDKVFREVVSAVALNDGRRAHEALESMHGRMEKTQEALHAGEVRLRKNASKVAEFEMMDREFHANLERLAKAAHRNDGREMTILTKKLLDGCISCHSRFRP